MPRSKPAQPEGLKAIVGIAADDTEDWTEEFFLSPRANDPARLSLKRPVDTRDVKVDFPDDEESWDAEDGKVTPPRKLSFAPGGPSGVEKYQETEDSADFGDDFVVGSKLSHVPSSSNGGFTDQEDWDNEFGINDVVENNQRSMAQGFKHMIKEVEEFGQIGDETSLRISVERQDFRAYSIPNKCRIVSQLVEGRQAGHMIIRYPKGCEMDQLMFDGHRKVLPGQQLEEWLEQMVSQHEQMLKFMNKERTVQWLQGKKNKQPRLSLNELIATREVIETLYRKKAIPECLEQLRAFSQRLKSLARYLRPSKKGGDSNKPARRMSQDIDRTQFFRNLTSILHIAGIIDLDLKEIPIDLHLSKATAELKGSKTMNKVRRLSTDLLRAAAECLPEYKDSFAVLELRIAAHSLGQSSENRPIDLKLQHGSKGAIRNPNVAFVICSSYLRLYNRIIEGLLMLGKHPAEMDTPSLQTVVSILADLYFYMNGISPLTLEFSQQLQHAVNELGELPGSDPEDDDDNSFATEEEDEEDEEEEEEEEDDEFSESEPTSDGEGRKFDERSRRTQHANEDHDEDWDAEFESAPPSSSHMSTPGRRHRSSVSFSASAEDLPTASPMFSGGPFTDRRSSAGAQRRKSRMRTQFRLEERITIGGDDDPRELLQLIQNDPALYKEMLLQDYRRYAELSWAKHRGALALGGLCKQAGENAAAETFYVEALFVLSKLSYAQTDIPLLTEEGSHTLEKVGDILVRNGKYKFGIVALEGAIQCHQLQNTREERRLYRKLSLTTQEHKDIPRTLKYNSYMLKIAYDARNFNEFVFVADAMSRLLMELGAFQQAESCMKIASQLLDGLPPASIVFRRVDDDPLIPISIELPAVLPQIQPSGESRRRRLHEVPSTPSSLQQMVASNNGLLDSQQLQLQFKMADTLMTGYKHQQAVDVLKRLLKRRLPSQSRAMVLMKLARCYLKLRLVGACEASLNRLTQEADEVIVSLKERGENAGLNATTAAVGLVSIVRSVEYFVCRCRARLAIDDPMTALHWLSIAFSVCPKGKFGQLGQLHYLQGRAYEALCLSLHDHDTGEILDADEEARTAKLAEEHFRQAYTDYRKTDDYVHQVKALTRIAQLQAARLFPLVALRGIPANEALNGTGAQILADVEEVAALALELAGDLASPLPLAFALTAFAEISFLQQRNHLAQSAWAETQALLRLTFLQQSADDEDSGSIPSLLGDPFSATSSSSGFFDQTKNIAHTPLFGMPLPTLQHPPGLMLRLHSILTRLVRLAFVLRPSRLNTHSELLGSWMRFDLQANALQRSYASLRPLGRRRPSKFDLTEHIAQSLGADTETKTHSPRLTPRLNHPSSARPIIPAERRRASKRFARFVRIAELDHIITIRADPPIAHAAQGAGGLRSVPSRATTVSDKSDRTAGGASVADAMEVIKHAFALDVGISAVPKAVSAVEKAVLDLQHTPAAEITTVMNADGTIVEKDAVTLAAQQQARIRGRSVAPGVEHAREPSTPMPQELHPQASMRDLPLQPGLSSDDANRELFCAAYFLQLRMYTRMYVSGKMALSNFAEQNMQTLRNLVKYSPYLRAPRNETWTGAEETKQHSPPPADEDSPPPPRPAPTERGHHSERRLLQSSRQDSFRIQMRRRSTQDEAPGPKPGHKPRLSDGQAVAAVLASRNSSGNGSPRQAATLNHSPQQSSAKSRTYPLSFRFCIYMDGCFLFHCPHTAERHIVPLSSHTAVSEQLQQQPQAGGSKLANIRVDTAERKSEPGNDAVEQNILRALKALPLIPGEEPVLAPMDDTLTVVVERLGYKYVLFLVNALLLEQPVLLVASPGHEEALVFCATALLRLLRPLQWQHIYIPLVHCSMRTMLRAVVNAKVPFLMGAYHDILDSLMANSHAPGPAADRDVIAFGDARARSTLFKTVSYQALAHVTIVDLDAGIIIPGSGLKYAATTTMSSAPVPDIDRGIVEYILEQQHANRAKEQGQVFLPPIPPRYRLALHQRMDVASTALFPADLQDRDKGKRRVSHNSVASTHSVGFFGAQCVAEAFRGGLFTVMISLFKGLRLFVYDPTTVPAQREQRRRAMSERRASDTSRRGFWSRLLNRSNNTLPAQPSNRQVEERVPMSRPIPESEAPFFITEGLMFDCHGFLQFLKDDVRPFMRCLVHTAAFKALVGTMVAWYAEPPPDDQVADTYMKMFCTAAHQRMEQKLRIYSTVAEKRVVGYLLTYFVRAVREEQEQPHSFVHQFPYMPTESTRVKRRWCVLDAQRLTYFRSHSKGRIKDHVSINPDNVRLVNSPFSGHEGTQTNETDYFALVINEARVIVLRAELRQSHDKWLQALRARLLRDDARERMDVLYAGLKATL